jgi:hypothetical protein
MGSWQLEFPAPDFFAETVCFPSSITFVKRKQTIMGILSRPYVDLYLEYVILKFYFILFILRGI